MTKLAARAGAENRIMKGLDVAEYHAHPSLSRSALLTLERTPKHFWYRHLSGLCEQEDSDALRFGSAFHTLVLEPHLFDSVCHVWSGKPRNTKEGKDDYAAAQAQAAGRLLIKESEHDDMRCMAESIRDEPASKKIIGAAGQIEASFFWYDEDYRAELRCRPDYYRDDGIVLDLKTCADAGEDAFQKSIVNYGYDLQAFMCMEGIEKVTGKRPADFVFMCVEKEPPYCVAFYSATTDLLACGAARYHKLMALYADCRARNEWPGYGPFVRPVTVPEWYIKKLANRGVAEHV